MKNLTLLERIVSIVVALMIITLGLFAVDELPTNKEVNAIWITFVVAISVVFIDILLKKIHELRGHQQKIEDYNEIRERMIITKFSAHLLKCEEKEYRLLVCNKHYKSPAFCRACEHSTPHEHTDDCDKYGCESVILIQG